VRFRGGYDSFYPLGSYLYGASGELLHQARSESSVHVRSAHARTRHFAIIDRGSRRGSFGNDRPLTRRRVHSSRTTNTQVEVEIARHASARTANRAGDVKSCRWEGSNKTMQIRPARPRCRFPLMLRGGLTLEGKALEGNARDSRERCLPRLAFTRTIKCFYNTLLRSRGDSLCQPACITTPLYCLKFVLASL
jgi:hypothetical protein